MKIAFSMLSKPKTKTEYKCHLRKRINKGSKRLDQSFTMNRIHVRSPTFAANNFLKYNIFSIQLSAVCWKRYLDDKFSKPIYYTKLLIANSIE